MHHSWLDHMSPIRRRVVHPSCHSFAVARATVRAHHAWRDGYVHVPTRIGPHVSHDGHGHRVVRLIPLLYRLSPATAVSAGLLE